MKRRKALKWSLIGGGIGLGALVLGGGGTVAYLYSQAKINTVGQVDFDNALAVPPLAESAIDGNGARVFRLEVQAGERQFKDGPATPTWGVNGAYLGPTLRASRGEEVAVAVHNGIDETTSLHWHGMHLPAAQDGGPHQAVEPDGDWTPQWTINQPAATLWYHPHPHGQTGKHVYRGVAGMFILDDDQADELNLPAEYGVDDLPMIVQDRRFHDDNTLDEDASFISSIGILGDEILVNGTMGPYREVTTRLVRLRLLNASNARVFNFGFSDDRGFDMIASDGGLLAAPFRTDRIQLSPGERAEIVVAFAPGETVDLRSYPNSPGLGADAPQLRFNGGEDSLDVCRFTAAAELTDETEVPDTLGEAPDLDLDDVAAERSFELLGFEINGESMDMNRIDFGVRVDTTEVWEVVNVDGDTHNFHVHDVQFQVLDIDGQAPPEYLSGWKDTVQLATSKRYRLAMRFSEYTDPNVPYMYHCHILFHEDSGLMGQFVVLGEDEAIGRVPESTGAHDHP
ncbi:multicopper oxidase family protein [Glycomyces buryatensis]|uniref:Copper oxidase n=1 Tax=Glycomyces buryatensis TaxID=2570927 RepID=A0A4S8QDQ8_9ACTN|nr:multicopper oxidase domain-containing protein [Glycomyces buryatensis]THV41781.1 copper oxidase [Glycomyces buryatensis]